MNESNHTLLYVPNLVTLGIVYLTILALNVNDETKECYNDECFCEPLSHHVSIILQPSATWSNLTYIILSNMLIVYEGFFLKDGTTTPFRRTLYMILMQFLGTGSFLHHAVHLRWTAFLDNISVGMYLSMLIAIVLERFSSSLRVFFSVWGIWIVISALVFGLSNS